MASWGVAGTATTSGGPTHEEACKGRRRSTSKASEPACTAAAATSPPAPSAARAHRATGLPSALPSHTSPGTAHVVRSSCGFPPSCEGAQRSRTSRCQHAPPPPSPSSSSLRDAWGCCGGGGGGFGRKAATESTADVHTPEGARAKAIWWRSDGGGAGEGPRGAHVLEGSDQNQRLSGGSDEPVLPLPLPLRLRLRELARLGAAVMGWHAATIAAPWGATHTFRTAAGFLFGGGRGAGTVALALALVRDDVGRASAMRRFLSEATATHPSSPTQSRVAIFGVPLAGCPRLGRSHRTRA